MIGLHTLYQRLQADPVAHLGRKSISLVSGYELGYDLALERWGRPSPLFRFDPQMFRSWTERRFGWPEDEFCRHGLKCFATLMSVDDASALDNYVQLFAEASSQLEEVPPRPSAAEVASQSLIEFLCFDRFRTRPAMWMGNGSSADHLWALCSGYCWAERDMNVGSSSDAQLMRKFQDWMAERYPFARGQPWNRVLNFLSLGSPQGSFDLFFEMFDMFRAGNRPEALSSTARTMVSAITQQLISQNPSADPGEAEKWAAAATKRIGTK